MTEEQTRMLAALEQTHGRVLRIADESPAGDVLLSQCVTGTRAYRCHRCRVAFTIEPDGECSMWQLSPS